MTRFAVCLVLLAAVLPLAGQPAEKGKEAPAAKTLLDSWQAGYFEGIKMGHVHTLVTQEGVGDKARIHTRRKMSLVIKRYDSVLPIQIEQTCVESPEGKVYSLGLTQLIGESEKVTMTGEVEGKTILVKRNDEAGRKTPWDEETLGLYAQEAIFQAKNSKPGDKVKLLSYELLIPGPLTIRATVKDSEVVGRLELKQIDGKARIVRTPTKLLRVEVSPDVIKVGGTDIRLPGKTVWLDAKLMPAREEFEIPGLGILTMYTTTKDAALKEGVAPDRLPDFGLNISIPLKQDIEEPYRTKEAIYRITLKEKIPDVFTKDRRQEIREEKDNTFELVVKAVREPGTNDKAKTPAKEYYDSNTYIDSDDARVKNLTRAVVRAEKDDWKKALLLEKWVHDNMKVSTALGFPTAAQVAKDLEGDCRQHALLLAAMCRAAGVPSRTAIGLIYARENGRSPFFGFHMWVEVWVKGRWVALDAILGQGGVAATHLKMGHHSWDKTTTLAPLLPISRTLGKIKIEVIESK
jgi:transglutaminase-like putative cysteine protease